MVLAPCHPEHFGESVLRGGGIYLASLAFLFIHHLACAGHSCPRVLGYPRKSTEVSVTPLPTTPEGITAVSLLS